MKPFQLVLIIIFASLALIAVLVLATFSGTSRESIGEVSVWGPLPESLMRDVMQSVRTNSNEFKDVEYTFVPEEVLITSLVESIAGGRGPDLVVFPASSLISERDKLLAISYRSIPRRTFQDTFIEAGEIFLSEDGVYGVPFYIDPYITYWNRTLFSESGIARAPRFWDEYTDIAPRLTEATEAGTLTQSAVALGEWDNIRGAKDIFLSLIAGLGNPVIELLPEDELRVTLAARGDEGISPAQSALRFYTEFADPVQSVYSWNRAQPDNRDAFVAGLLGVYLGRASEVLTLRSANPNLNFDIAPYPMYRGGIVSVPAVLYGLSIPRGSQNPQGALRVAQILSGNVAQQALSSETGLPSVRRDQLPVSPDNPYEGIFRDAALNSFVFIDPSPQQTDAILKRMVENVSSGRQRISEAVFSAQGELEQLMSGVQ